MKKYLFSLFLLSSVFNIHAQVQRPKLVVGIVVDQMRWDYLQRYNDRYAPNGGFKRLMSKGFNCNSTMIPFTPTYTACGHASIYTGSVPSIHGITGNNWFDNKKQQYVYCTDDPAVSVVGSTNAAAGNMSPVNMFTTTICDELKLATNQRSKVVGIALKDRGGILPAGHSANAAYWYDSKTGDWITSSYYMKALPGWVNTFNEKKLVDEYYKLGWSTIFPINSYTQSTSDENDYEVKVLGKGFPYTLSSVIGKNYSIVLSTPFGNTLTTQFAKSAIENEQLGADSITDLLAISYSSTDYIGHAFGPNSIENEDTYLRLDKELAELLDYLDSKVGKDDYLVFLTSDHGAAHNPKFMNDLKIPAGNVLITNMVDSMNLVLKQKFAVDALVKDIINFQVVLNLPVIARKPKLKTNEITEWIIQYLLQQEAVANVFAFDQLKNSTIHDTLKSRIANGYYQQRCGQIQIVLKPQWLEGFENGGTTHGLWNPYDSHIPLIWYGWKIQPGSIYRETYMTDIAATLAALLKIQAPSGNIGQVITELIR
ncbi:alkaline phosphatase PafA [Lacibacter sp. H407]|uniref:alkaline phosphatase PafA n=1 Tax=Lacibacter sp. H407 TaxID=3133423 RepID=UPI0030BA664C